MSHDTWRMGFHLMPPTGWLNDPNGLCQLNGTYHVFFQYSPDWPAPHAPRGWGHFASDDLVSWRAVSRGFVIAPDTPDEASGAYSGCAVPVNGGARFYYTGNVKEVGDFDYVHDGRRSVQILIESPDGYQMGEKNVLLRNADYPAFCTRHVRDPKVWRAGGTWWMTLGARDENDCGLVLKLHSDDGLAWENAGTVRTGEPFGFMWECPDRVALDGREWLSLCPQGMQGLPWANGVRDQSGYLPLPEGETLGRAGETMLDTARFRRWDRGFDFYAPQTFVDESGRTLLVGWMGVPEVSWESAPEGLSWCHCLTVPREVTAGADGVLLQRPARELEALRGARHELAAGGTLELAEHRADVVAERVAGPLELTLDDALTVSWDGARLALRFSDDAVGCGRTERSAPCDDLRDLRVLIDSSAVEVFANDGELAFATRWFPRADTLAIVEKGPSLFHVWEMGDGMAGTY
ncbi:glycoside hydrolase family 32 protein [Olsenella uli]|uniref:glycoside hydrolase family 32 protein n=1 Tax=Olsenella uli TaxID=133926 RepID=UPI001957782A|nr:glycoside hydrolase family 32 protein [Olsenella uli]MBM6676238.1 glycoside hydrolase family 32 protein [Olsenella uli]